MNPYNSSYTDPNQPYRTAIQALADGYGCVPMDSEMSSSPSNAQQIDQRWQGLEPIHSHASASHSSPSVSVDHVINAFYEAGFHYNKPIKKSTVANRLREINLQSQTLIDAIQIAQSPQHPIMQPYSGNFDFFSHKVVHDLAGILRHSGLPQEARTAIIQSNHDANRIVTGILSNYSVF